MHLDLLTHTHTQYSKMFFIFFEGYSSRDKNYSEIALSFRAKLLWKPTSLFLKGDGGRKNAILSKEIQYIKL